MESESEVLCEIRDLLRLIAEPAMAQRDRKMRAALLAIVGKKPKRQAAALLMDGTRTQQQIADQSDLDQSNVSRLTKSLLEAGLATVVTGKPKLGVIIQATFFDQSEVTLHEGE